MLRIVILLLATLLLTTAAHLRPPEYDEAYSIFLTAGDARPAWPTTIFHPADVQKFYIPHATPMQIARDLRAGDVHPPLYFWVLEYWRRLAGPSWFAARMLSVLFSVAALAALAWLAELTEMPVVPALLVALLSYGFAYTGIVARGFALAQLLNILGMALTTKAAKDQKWQPALAAGIALGAAAFTNYLAIFIGLSALFWLFLHRTTRKLTFPVATGLALFLPASAYFFIAQRNARIGQFVPFSFSHAILRLATESGAALFGGLPIYAGGAKSLVAASLTIVIVICAGLVIRHWQAKLTLFAIAAIATPLGLLALGLIFNNTPIEIRYLAFAMPFVSLLLAQTLPRFWRYFILGLEACGFAGLCIATATAQPQGLAALALSKLTTPNTLVLLPFGNDGVGIPGPFIALAPKNLRLQLVKPNTHISLANSDRVIVVTIDADAASRLATENALTIFKNTRIWQEKSTTALLKVFVRISD